MVKKVRKEFTLAAAKIIGEKLGMDWEQFDVKEFRLGLNTELMDGIYNPITNFASDDPLLIGKIVRAHLNEAPDYYTRWLESEKAAVHNPSGKPPSKKMAVVGLSSLSDEKTPC